MAAFFDGLLEVTREGLKTTNTTCLIDAFEGLYRRQFRLASGVAASLHPQQIRALEAKFAEDARKAARKSGPVGATPAQAHRTLVQIRRMVDRPPEWRAARHHPRGDRSVAEHLRRLGGLPQRPTGRVDPGAGRPGQRGQDSPLPDRLAGLPSESDPTTAEGAAPARAPLHASGRQLQPDPTGPLQGPARRPAGRFHEDSEILTHGAPEIREVRSIAAHRGGKFGPDGYILICLPWHEYLRFNALSD